MGAINSDAKVSIERFQLPHVSEASAIHADALEGDFLPSLGSSFLVELYGGLIDLELGFGFVARDADRIRGFVFGSRDSAFLFHEVLRKRFLKLGWKLLGAITRNPHIVLEVVETVRNPSKEEMKNVSAELMVIAVADGWRGMGLGHRLIERFDREAQAMQIPGYKVTVHRDKQRANRFYRNLGFIHRSQFRLYGKDWNVYTRTFSQLSGMHSSVVLPEKAKVSR